MINDGDAEQLAVLEIVDDIQRLGLGTLFENDIKRVLERIFSDQILYFKEHKSLHATAIAFRLLRQHRYPVSQDVFRSFMDDEGNFWACTRNDIKGMLSLYEASFLSVEGEDLLDKAFVKIREQLSNVNTNLSSRSEERITRSLELPLHRKIHLLEARHHVEAYAKRDDANNDLFQLAKLNFNMVQSILRSDLRDMSSWWNDLGLTNNMSFARDRIMECFFWTVGMVHEPQFSSCRKGLTKVTSFITIIDDIYDVYGTIEELELFTEAVERWDVGALKNLPDYMHLCFLAFYNSVNEMGYENLKNQGTNVIPWLTKAWADLFKTFMKEARWSSNHVTPSFEEYVDNAWRSVSGSLILTHTYFLLADNISQQEVDSLLNYHEMLRWPSTIFRLCNDLATSADEVSRGESVNAITCYMKETGLSEQHAREHINKLIDQAWKKMNQCRLSNNTFPKPFMEAANNLARISHCVYQNGDAHGAPDQRSKNRVLSLIIEPIPMLEPNVNGRSFPGASRTEALFELSL